jgi:hypothetical protein
MRAFPHILGNFAHCAGVVRLPSLSVSNLSSTPPPKAGNSKAWGTDPGSRVLKLLNRCRREMYLALSGLNQIQTSIRPRDVVLAITFHAVGVMKTVGFRT